MALFSNIFRFAERLTGSLVLPATYTQTKKCISVISQDILKQNLSTSSLKNNTYPPRVNVPQDLLSWKTPFPAYAPPLFTHMKVLTGPAWADPKDFTKVTRKLISFEGNIQLDGVTGLPLNPRGRTGIQGRGALGKWGPNFSADPIITSINLEVRAPAILVIQRKDNGMWALPGGMIETGDDVQKTLMKELEEETGVVLDMSQATEVYKGYVEDPRNTDNAWIETVVKHLHLCPKDALQLKLKAGSDAKAVQWMLLTDENIGKLYANHETFVRKALTDLLYH